MARFTVLIVDEDREVTQYLSDVFGGEGWKVLCEKDGDWALKTFQSRRIDAVVLDTLTPVLNGFQVTEAIRADPRGADVPIVLLSGVFRGAESRREAIERFGLLAYLNKPVDGDQLRQLLADALAGSGAAPRRSAGPSRTRSRPLPRSATGPRPAEAHPLEPEPRVVARQPVPLRGSLEQASFGRVLHALYKLQASGALFLMRGSVKKIVYVESGQPVVIKSNLMRECLGPRLVAEGRLEADAAEQTFQESRSDKVLHGQVLLRRSLLSEAELAAALRLQLEEKLFEIFGWTSGEFQFKENARLPAWTQSLLSSCATTVVRGVIRSADRTRIDAALRPSQEAYPAPASDPFLRFQCVDLSPEDEALAATLDGSRALAEVLQDSRWSRRQASCLVYGLHCAGVVDLWDRPQQLPPVRTTAWREAHLEGLPLPRHADPQLQEYLAADLVRLKKRDHFRVLDLPRTADTAAVEAAFDRRAWRFHPDLYADTAPEVRGLAEGVFNRLRAAYLVLRNPFRRDGYTLQLGQADEGEDDATVLADAERHYGDGRSNLDRGRYEKAVWHLRRAAALDEHDARYSAYLGWAVHKVAPTDHVAATEARRHLERAIQLDPQLDLPHLFFGYLYLAEDESANARACFEKALRLNPDNTEVAEQLQLLPR